MGSRVWGECMRSGRRVLRDDMVRDGQNRQLLVAPDEYDEYHPQLLVSPPRNTVNESKVLSPAPEIIKLVPPVLTAVIEDPDGEGGMSDMVRIEWTAGETPGLWRMYQLFRVTVETDAAELLDTFTIERDWDASILTDIRETFDDPADKTLTYRYYVIAIDHEGQSVPSNEAVIASGDWPPAPEEEEGS